MRLKFAAALTALLAVPAVLAQSESGEFTVGDIRVEGLQRITEGTVFNYLPVNIGDRLDQQRIDESLRALYATGFFRDVELRRDGGTLIIVVARAPSIESFTIEATRTSRPRISRSRCATQALRAARRTTSPRSMRSSGS
jgi:outer membrane protein insertion porin family